MGKALDARIRALSPVVVITGHYGVGKTNFAMNLAIDCAAAGMQACLADLDIVNPYFRSSDYAQELERSGVAVIAPVLAGTSLDIPSISGRVSTEIDRARTDASRNSVIILDAGGDDVGATVLARFAPQIAGGDYDMLYVVNAYRNLTSKASDAVDVLRQIEGKSCLKATAVVNNSHLHEQTDEATVADARAFGEEVGRLADLPIAFVTKPFCAVRQTSDPASIAVCDDGLYYVRRYVKTPWE